MPILPDSTYATLKSILQDIRMLVRGLSDNQISDEQIMYWLNTFMLYDMPSILRQQSLKGVFKFYTSPFVDVYDTNTTVPTDPFYNFNNRYITTHEPFYCGGLLGNFTQSREAFFGNYPNVSFISLITYGNNVQTNFTGTVGSLQQNQFSSVSQLQLCIVRNQVLFSSIDGNGNALQLIDTPINAYFGNLSIPNQPPTSLINVDPANFINYVTGQFSITFPTAPGSGINVNSQTVPLAPAQPQTLLWYDNKITLRPIPDQPYICSIEAFVRPTVLLQETDMPQIAQWYQYIVYGTATKIFQMRGDMDSVDRIASEFKKQELLVGRTTLVQLKKNRVPTIFVPTYGANVGVGYGFFGNNSI